MLVRVHTHAFILFAFHAHLEVRQNHQLFRSPQLCHPLVKQGLP